MSEFVVMFMENYVYVIWMECCVKVGEEVIFLVLRVLIWFGGGLLDFRFGVLVKFLWLLGVEGEELELVGCFML